MHAGDTWFEKLAMFISQRCAVSLICCLWKMPRSSSTCTGSQIATWRRSLTWTRHEFDYYLLPPSTGKMFVWPPAFLSEPGSARYSSALSITTVWSNYQTSYNDFFEVYITETVTLSPNIQTVYNLQTMSRDHLKSVIRIHKYVNVQASVVGPQ